MTLTAPPPAPQSTNPSTFNALADPFLAWFSTHVTEMNALLTQMAGSFIGASATSFTAGTGSKTFSATAGLNWQVGQPLMIASASSPATYMTGPITAYNSSTGSLTVNVTASGTAATKADWIISLVPAGYTPGQIAGTATNDSATAGNIGEYLESEILTGSAVSLTASTAANVTSLSLTAGDWNVWGNIGFTPAGSTLVSNVGGWISTTSAALPTAPNKGAEVFAYPNPAAGSANHILPVGQRRLLLNATTTVYLGGYAVFTTSTCSAYGTLCARRAR